MSMPAVQRWALPGFALVLLAALVATFVVLTGGGGEDRLLPSSSPTPSTAAPTPSPSASPSVVPSPSASAMRPSPTGASPSPSRTALTLTAVDVRRRPLAGLFVYAFAAPATPSKPLGRTAADGRLTLGCGSERILLSPWQLGQRQPAQMPDAALTWAGGGRTFEEAAALACRDTVVVVQPGATLTGVLAHIGDDGVVQPYRDHAWPGGGLYCRALGIDQDGPQCADFDPVGGRYAFRGLAPGTYLLQGMYSWDDVAVAAGRTTERDWYECDDCTAGRRPSPAPSPSAAPSPEETGAADG